MAEWSEQKVLVCNIIVYGIVLHKELIQFIILTSLRSKMFGMFEEIYGRIFGVQNLGSKQK